jgi:hypothetical protein
MDSSMSSTRPTTPLGDILIPDQSEKWKSERKRLWEGIKASVSIFCEVRADDEGQFVAPPLRSFAIPNLCP